jgi:hypothetical protein
MSQPYLAQSARGNSNSIFSKEFEIVEDSEPEREALRSSLRVQGAWEDSLSDSIIELTDKEDDDVGCAPLPSSALVSSVHAAKSTFLEVRDSSVLF